VVKTLAGEIEHETDHEQHSRALALVEALHLQGFSSLWMESVKMFRGGLSEGEHADKQVQHEALRVVIDEREINGGRLLAIMEVAAQHDAMLVLADIRIGDGQQFSRVALWPSRNA
jgi:hypothetical protein